ncbi:MAG: helix-turn-helix domain-containing protein [Planctomycetota bacterium]
MTAPQESLARILTDLAEVGRKLVETSESALALLEAGEAECGRDVGEPAPTDPMTTTETSKAASLMTRVEVSALLRIDPRTFSRLRNDPRAKFPAPFRRARALRWRRSEVEAWVEGRRSS